MNFLIGIRNTSIPNNVINCIEEILFKTSQNLKKDKVLNTLKMAETYLPDIMQRVHEKLAEEQEEEW